jgi:hypothetical protein
MFLERDRLRKYKPSKITKGTEDRSQNPGGRGRRTTAAAQRESNCRSPFQGEAYFYPDPRLKPGLKPRG